MQDSKEGGSDRRVIELLRAYPRASNAFLAGRLGISPPAVANRIRKLVKSGTIRVTTFIDPNRIGAPVGTIIGLRVAQRRVAELLDIMARHPATANVTLSSGRFNLLEVAFFDSLREMSRFLGRVLLKQPGILSSEVFVLLQLTNGEQDVASGEPYDETDWRIVAQLRKDGRISTADIARQIGVNATTVQRHLKAMLGTGRLRLVTMINDKSVDWYFPGAIGLRVRRPYVLPVLKRLKEHRKVAYATACTGRFDLFASVSAETAEALHDLAEEEFAGWKGVIETELFPAITMLPGPILGGERPRPADAKETRRAV